MTSRIVIVLIGLLAGAAQAAERADLVLYNGRIITMDARDSVVEAIAVKDRRVLAVGSSKRMLALAGKGTRLVDLGGRAATPGLIDSHAHISEGGTNELFAVGLTEARSIADIGARVAAGATALQPGEWLYGSGWDEGKLVDHRLPGAADLDRVVADHPVWLQHTTGHYGVANSLALKLAGIDAATADPAAGTIDRDDAGKPTGLLREAAAMQLVTRLIPPPSVERIKAGILHEIDILHREGITAVKDPAISRRDWEAYRALLAEGNLRERVCVLWSAGTTEESARAALTELQAAPHAPAALGDGRLISCGAKIFMDGSGGARTAWMNDDWNRDGDRVDSGNRGYPTTDPEQYRAMLRLFHQGRYQVGTHAIGDHAIDWVADSYDELLRQDPARGVRHTIIHANLPSPHALAVIARLERDFDSGYPEAQASFLWWIGDTYAGNYGPARAPHVVPLKSFLANGISWGGGSDFPVTPVAARYGLWASLARETLGGSYGKQPFGTDEAVDIHDALRSYTRWAAPLLFLESKAGSLEVGKRADLAVWDGDPYSLPPARLKDLKCLMTLLDGEPVYRAEVGAPALTVRK